jgi:hypothetical protein
MQVGRWKCGLLQQNKSAANKAGLQVVLHISKAHESTSSMRVSWTCSISQTWQAWTCSISQTWQACQQQVVYLGCRSELSYRDAHNSIHVLDTQLGQCMSHHTETIVRATVLVTTLWSLAGFVCSMMRHTSMPLVQYRHYWSMDSNSWRYCIGD